MKDAGEGETEKRGVGGEDAEWGGGGERVLIQDD